MSFVSNPQLDLAFEYVRNTRKNIFLTGKAGTGKIVCVISGGNIDAVKLIKILEGKVP